MDPTVVLSAALAFLSVGAALFGARAFAAAPRAEVLERAARVTSRAAAEDPVLVAPKKTWFLASLLAPLAGLARPKDAEEVSRARRALVHAGFRGDLALEMFYGAKIALAAALGGGILLASSLQPTPIPDARLIAVVLVGLGYYVPSIWVNARAKARQTAIGKSLADTLDLLVTCVEAGLALDAAIARIGRDIGHSAPQLSSELQLTTSEIQAGITRADAFRRLAERTGVDELRTLSGVIIQTDMFGTPVAQALRVHSSFMRTKRTHRAEEKAAAAGVKMILPLILFILPSLFCVILGPAIVHITTTLLPNLGGVK